MQLNNLSRKTPNKKSVQVGRGGTRGKTAGKGTKGQNARSGRKKRPELRDIIKRLPKLRGRGASPLKSITTAYVAVNVGKLSVFSKGSVVTPRALQEAGMIERRAGSLPQVKILAAGELSHPISVKGCVVSASARAKIEAAGGTVS
jgi:large subunit ribosomal protein L15